jgi:hypothetical protein
MKTIEELTFEYNVAHSTRDRARNELRDKIERHEQQIERLNKRLSRVDKQSVPFWGDAIILPIMDELTARHPDLIFDHFGPFGLGCTMSIHAYDRAEKIAAQTAIEASAYNTPERNAAHDADRSSFRHSISFRPSHGDNGLYVEIVDFAHPSHEFPKGSIGDMSDLGYDNVPIESFEQIEAALFAGTYEHQH